MKIQPSNIIANELDHFGPEDLAQDTGAASGHGGSLHKYSLGFAQISPDGLRDMAKQFDAEVRAHNMASNPLARFEKMNNDELAKALVNPANAPLFVAAHIAIDLQTLNRHKNELHVTAVALGYWYNADMGYAATDRKHEHVMTKKDAQDNGMPFYPSLPTDEPFMITFGLLVSHEKNKAYDDLQRGRPISGQVVGKPADTIEAWEMAAGFTACLSTPVGLLGLVGYGGFLLCAKLARPSKKGQ